MPFSVRHAYFTRDDGEELAPERESGNSWDLAERRDVERIDVCPIYKVDRQADTKSASKNRSSWIFTEYLSYNGCPN